MKICVIGTGYVGLVAGTCFAETGNTVICVDNDNEKIKKLKKAVIPIYEPGLEDLIKTNLSEGRLSFTNNIADAIKKSQVCFIAVGTPQNNDGNPDLSAVYDVVIQIAKTIEKYTVIVHKSTVPIGTSEKIKKLIQEHTDVEFDIVSNPEFLKQGAAVDDFLKPDRIIIGAESQRAADIMSEIYTPFVRTGNPIMIMDIKSAEMTKYASNAFLAVKVSFANEIANICEKVGANIESVRSGMCADRRIGSRFLFAGLGYGGSCFPKDIEALINISKENCYDPQILKAANELNKSQRIMFLNKIIKRFDENIKGKTFALWGLSFKPNTNDMREAPSITIIEQLLKRGAKIKAYDPKAMENAKVIFKNRIEYAKSAFDALKDSDALILITEWNEFRNPDFEMIKANLKEPVIFDGRNQYNPVRLKALGFDYYGIGK